MYLYYCIYFFGSEMKWFFFISFSSNRFIEEEGCDARGYHRASLADIAKES